MFSINNKIISDSQVAAEEFNNFFVSIKHQQGSSIIQHQPHVLHE